MKKIIYLGVFSMLLGACFENKDDVYKKGFQVSSISVDEEGNKVVGFPIDSLVLDVRPMQILETKYQNIKLIPLFKVSYNKKGIPTSGEVNYHFDYSHEPDNDYRYYDEEEKKCKKRPPSKHNWNGNFLPGLQAVYGYNMVNVSYYDFETRKQHELFDKYVLVKTLYFPANTKDTLNYQPVDTRNYLMVSAYDEDTNKDGFISIEDLRRFYLFDIKGRNRKNLIPKNYSVMQSDYDEENDVIYVYTRWDKNNNGKVDFEEPTQIFWIDLKKPENNGIVYETK